MTIAVHIDESYPGEESVLYQCIKHLCEKNTADHFIFFVSKPDVFIAGENCTPVIISPVIKNSLILHYWYNYKLPALLKRYNADVFISEHGICSLNTDIAQWIIGDGTSRSGRKNNSQYKKKFLRFFLKKIAGLVVSHEESRIKLLHDFPDLAEKIHVIPSGVPAEYVPLSELQKEEVKIKYTNGTDYFIFSGDASQFTEILKSFSQFKKWQRSGLRLVLMADRPGIHHVKNFGTYKYRDDVHIIQPADQYEHAKLFGAAYAIICRLPDGNPAKVYKALKCEVPVIVLEKSSHDNFPCLPSDQNQVAASMMTIYKDEHSRNDLVQKGREYVARFTWENSAALLLERIQKYS